MQLLIHQMGRTSIDRDFKVKSMQFENSNDLDKRRLRGDHRSPIINPDPERVPF